MSSNDVARDLINRVLERDGAEPRPMQVGGYFPARDGNVIAPGRPNGAGYQYGPLNNGGALPIYTVQQQGVMPPPLYQQDAAMYAPSRGFQVQQMPSRGADTDYVNQSFSEALGRARQKWNFNLMMSLIIAGMIIIGVISTGLWMMMGQSNALTAIFGTGATVLGMLSWVLARPAAQLNDADNQVSLLMMIWTKYTQDLQVCERITDPSAAAACVSKAGGEAIDHFSSIVSKPSNTGTS